MDLLHLVEQDQLPSPTQEEASPPVQPLVVPTPPPLPEAPTPNSLPVPEAPAPSDALQPQVPYTQEEVPQLLRHFYKGKKTEEDIQKIIQAHGEKLMSDPKFTSVLSKIKNEASENEGVSSDVDISLEEVPVLLHAFYKGTKTDEEIQKIIEFHGDGILTDPRKMMLLSQTKDRLRQERDNIQYPNPARTAPIGVIEEDIHADMYTSPVTLSENVKQGPYLEPEKIIRYLSARGIEGKKGLIYGRTGEKHIRKNLQKILRENPSLLEEIQGIEETYPSDIYELDRGLPMYTRQFKKSIKITPDMSKLEKRSPSIKKALGSLKGVNFNKVIENEGGIYTTGYVPNYQKKGTDPKVIGNSGVTIGAGTDLGSTTKENLESYDLSEETIAKLEPYLGLKKDAALKTLMKNPLELPPEEAIKLTVGKASDIVSYTERLAKKVDSKFVFGDAPTPVKDLMFDLTYQGLSGVNHKLFKYLIKGEYDKFIQQAKAAEKQKAFGTPERFFERYTYLQENMPKVRKEKKSVLDKLDEKVKKKN